jgi:hypothetical protein
MTLARQPCYLPRHERSGKRQRTAPRCDLAAAVEDTSPIARRTRRSGATREGEEAYSDSGKARQRKEAVLAHEFLVLALDCDEPSVLEIEIAVMTPAASDIAAIYELSTGMPCRFRFVDMGWKTPRR